MGYSVIECYEEDHTVKEDFSLDGLGASVTVRCDWNARHALISDVLLNARPWPHLSPLVAPLAKSCSVQPHGLVGGGSGSISSGGFINYKDALVTINYSQEHRKKDGGEKIFSEEIEPTIEFLTMDHRDFRWTDAGGDMLLEAEAPGKLVRGLNYVKTFYFVQSPPASLLSLVGHVNSGAINSELLPFGFAEETLLYTPPHMSRSVSTTGGQSWTVRVKFSYKPDTWNKFWRSQSQSYEELVVYKTKAIYKNYPLASFSPLVNMGV